MPIDTAIDARDGAVGASMQTVEQLISSELGSAAALPGEQVSIHVLDTVGALLILIAEVREALSLVANSPLQSAVPQLGPASAPFTVIQMILGRLPAEESQPPAEWLDTATQLEGLVRMALDKAVDAVTAWRNVPPDVIAVVVDARTAVLAAMDEDSPGPLWLLPEMMPILPRMQRYWRLRRRLRRSLDRETATRSGDRDDAEETFA